MASRRGCTCAVGLVIGLAVSSAGCLAFAQDPPAAGPRIAYGPARQVCTLANTKVAESSGLACSRLAPGVFWTHNDSGDGPVLYAFNTKGEHLATCTVAGAEARDWEDVASFTMRGQGFLLIADTGDNDAKRPKCSLYVVREPPVGTAEKPAEVRARAALRIDFTYEDGPRDCEAVGIDPTTLTIYLCSKELGGGRIYALPWPGEKAAPGAPPRVARAIATFAGAPMPTAMDISPDGRRAVILSYLDAYEYVRGPDEDWAAAFGWKPRVLKMPRRNQGESIGYGPDGRTLYLTSEFAPTPLLEVPVAEAAPAAAPAAKPPEKPAEKPPVAAPKP